MAIITILTILLGTFALAANGLNNYFDAYYSYLWGGDHFYKNPQGTEVQLKLDQSYGAGFRSKSDYASGLFSINMKIPDKPTGGVVTSFYTNSARGYSNFAGVANVAQMWPQKLGVSGEAAYMTIGCPARHATSETLPEAPSFLGNVINSDELTEAPDNNKDPGNHFEIDFEFLGTNGTVQTNVYDNDTGHREQSFRLWFNPSQDFHTYQFLWNSHQIVFYVDNIPLRVFKNNMGQGVAYPNRPMHIEASIWNADWAGRVRWENAPFFAHYRDFGFYGCLARGNNVVLPNGYISCDSDKYFWNRQWQLNASQLYIMSQYRKRYMTYDYCWNPSTRKKECYLNPN